MPRSGKAKAHKTPKYCPDAPTADVHKAAGHTMTGPLELETAVQELENPGSESRDVVWTEVDRTLFSINMIGEQGRCTPCFRWKAGPVFPCVILSLTYSACGTPMNPTGPVYPASTKTGLRSAGSSSQGYCNRLKTSIFSLHGQSTRCQLPAPQRLTYSLLRNLSLTKHIRTLSTSIFRPLQPCSSSANTSIKINYNR